MTSLVSLHVPSNLLRGKAALLCLAEKLVCFAEKHLWAFSWFRLWYSYAAGYMVVMVLIMTQICNVWAARVSQEAFLWTGFRLPSSSQWILQQIYSLAPFLPVQ